MATIMDVAREAGVSRSTVSRVLNNRGEVDAETLARVNAAITKLDYFPNASARALAKQKTETIGVMLADLSDPFYEQIIGGIQQIADQHKYSVAFYNSRDDLTDHGNIVASAIRGNRVDGLLIVGSSTRDANLIQGLIATGLPVALIERNVENPHVPCVVCDNVQGAKVATEHLIKLGHRRIACIAGKLDYQSGLDRLIGFRAACAKHYVVVDDGLIVAGRFQNNGGYTAMLQLMQMEHRPTAVFACNDMMAIGAIRAASELGIRIPEDVAIVGFDDIQFASMIHPQLTTMSQPLFAMAARATKQLIDAMSRKNSKGTSDFVVSEKQVFSAELIVRKSCGFVN